MTRRAIIADDTEDMRVLLSMVLRANGWEVTHEAADGVEARQAWQDARGEFEALVLDHQMPHLTGLDLAREVRAIDQELPILLVSAHLDDDLRRQALELQVTCVDKVDAPRLGEFLPA